MRYRQRPLTGIGGWLAMFVVTLVLYAIWDALTGYGVAKVAAREPTQVLRSYVGLFAACLVLSAAGYALLGWLLVTRQRAGTVRLAATGLWALALVVPLGALVGRAAFLASDDHVVFSTDALYQLAYALICTTYLRRSRRVAATYAPRNHPLADVFG